VKNLGVAASVMFGAATSGSGFYVNRSNAVYTLYFITANHVLFDPKTGELLGPAASLVSYSGDPVVAGGVRVEIDLQRMLTDGSLISHAARDLAVIRIAREKTPLPTTPQAKADPEAIRMLAMEQGAKRVDGGQAPVVGVGNDAIARFDEVFVGNECLTFGYPVSLGLKRVPQLDPSRPLLRTGVVAGRNGTERTIILDSPVYPGNSGGPVFEVDNWGLGGRVRLIGIVLSFVPVDDTWLNRGVPNFSGRAENSGYPIAEPMDSALELIDALERADAVARAAL
jgi:S1-C subfamily serine protease